MAGQPRRRGVDPDLIADAIIGASAVLVRVTVEALDSLAPDLNLTDLRVLAVLDREGPQRLIDIATVLDATSTTATRIADRLAAGQMVERVRRSDDRREIHLAIAAAGRQLVGDVFSRRRQMVAEMLGGIAMADSVATMRVLDRITGSSATRTVESA